MGEGGTVRILRIFGIYNIRIGFPTNLVVDLETNIVYTESEEPYKINGNSCKLVKGRIVEVAN